MLYKIIFILIFVCYEISMFALLIKSKMFVKGLILNAVLGLFMLTVLKLIEQITLIKIYINSIWVLSAVCVGPIGVLLNIIIDCIFLN